MNRVVLIGNLVAKPEMSYTQAGTAKTKFRIAINRKYKDSGGELKEETTFVPIAVWGKQAESCAQYLDKGRLVAVDGRLSIHEFDGDDGTRKWFTEVIADNVQFLSTGNKGAAQDTQEESPF